MKAKKIMSKTDKELDVLTAELGGKITQARIDLSTKKSNDVKQISRLKKDLARSLTAQKLRQQAEAVKEAKSE